jgi:hypothetical protein
MNACFEWSNGMKNKAIYTRDELVTFWLQSYALAFMCMGAYNWVINGNPLDVSPQSILTLVMFGIASGLIIGGKDIWVKQQQ